MADIKIAYGTTTTALSITLANLGNLTARSSAYVDNTSNLFLDASLLIKVGIGNTTGSDNAVYVYGYGSPNSTNFSGWTSGTDAAVTVSISNMQLLGVISTGLVAPYTATDLTIFIGSVAQSFGGQLPPYWGIVLDNRSGGALVNTATNHYAIYQGIYATSL